MIFVVDDHPLMRDAMTMVLGRLRPGEEILEFACLGELATGLLARGCPDAIFLDLNLPDASGYSGVRQVRRQCPSVPLAVYSATPAAEAQHECIEAGANLYIEKTVNSQGLAAALAHLLKATQRPALAERTTDRQHAHWRLAQPWASSAA
ncbi:response regulator [Variovorax saccharolyticus]|uniref:response regulator n=1 Tax=Variovorax saccharolyticus TaxID=3053516 RepID=UPI002575ECB4|nr:response regulator transcription factor [Variovorax sp. J22R187]MDM0022853.1 response regulator transcription factor [Variovorax sp. J22R187]